MKIIDGQQPPPAIAPFHWSVDIDGQQPPPAIAPFHWSVDSK